MDVTQIERLMAAMVKHDVTELHFEEDGQTLLLSRKPGEKAVLQTAASAATAHIEESATTVETGGREVVSPMVGVFHPANGQPVKVGTKLKKGDVLCVIEAMKLMNDIVMEEDGEIVFLALNDGDMVEFGQMIAQYDPL